MNLQKLFANFSELEKLSKTCPHVRPIFAPKPHKFRAYVIFAARGSLQQEPSDSNERLFLVASNDRYTTEEFKLHWEISCGDSGEVLFSLDSEDYGSALPELSDSGGNHLWIRPMLNEPQVELPNILEIRVVRRAWKSSRTIPIRLRIWIDGPESRSTTIFVGPYPVDALRASPHIDPVVELLKSCTLLSFRELAVVGAYCRFSPEDRAALKTLVRRIRHSLKVKENCRANFLLWAPAGSGKTALIKEIALMEKVNFVEANLATSQEQFTDAIRKAINSKQPTLCLVDEIDAHAEERWPYESFFSYLEENLQRAHPLVFVMAGSAPNGIDSMIKGIEARFKGPDLISRIFDSDTRYCLPEHKMGDILIIFATRSMLHAKRLGRKIQGINKAVAYFLLRNVNYHRPRQLDELALRTVLRMTEDDEVMHFGHLFDPTDTNQYRFWHSHADSLDELAKSNIMLRP